VQGVEEEEEVASLIRIFLLLFLYSSLNKLLKFAIINWHKSGGRRLLA